MVVIVKPINSWDLAMDLKIVRILFKIIKNFKWCTITMKLSKGT